MDIVLVPGLWLDASSWGEVASTLSAAGHHVHALSMPGVGEPIKRSADIGISDWVSAVVERVDDLNGPVVLIGHSGGGNVVWGAADARPDRVARVIFIDTVPPPPGSSISEFPVVNGVVPFPGWDFFPDKHVADLTPQIRERTEPLMKSVPARVPTDEIALSGDRHRVSVTLLMGGMDADQFRAEIAQWAPYAEEFNAIADATIARIGSAHWPQFSVPDRLTEVILESIDKR